MNKTKRDIIRIIEEIYSHSMDVLNKNTPIGIAAISIIATNVFMRLYLHIIEDMPPLQKRLIADEIKNAINECIESTNKNETSSGGCTCDNCKSKTDKEINGQTIH